MSAIETLRDALYRNPPSSTAQPSREGVLAAFTELYQSMGLIGMGALIGVTKDTRANLEADLDYDADTVALVYADATDANKDLYIKVGASGTGSWTLTSILHDAAEALFAEPLALAQEWAEKPEDDEITGHSGQYSALHHAAKAADSAAAAAASVATVSALLPVSAANWAAGLAAVPNGGIFYLTNDGRRFYYQRVDASTADLYDVTFADQDMQRYAIAAAKGDTESPPSGLDIDFASADAFTRAAVVPNRAKGTPSLSLLASNRPSDTGFWELLGGSATRTRLYTGLITGDYALRVQYGGSGNGITQLAVFIPAGRWSLVATVKSASGTPAFRAGLNQDSGISSHTAPTSATRIVLNTQTFTTAATRTVYLFREAASPAAADLTFDDIYIVPGDGSVIPAQVRAIQPIGSQAKAAASGVLIQSGTPATSSPLHMLAPFGNGPVAITGFSLTFAVKRTGTTGSSQYLWSFPATGDYMLYNEVDNCLVFGLASVSGGFSDTYWEVPLPLNEFAVIGVVDTGTETRHYVEGVRMRSTAHSAISGLNVHGMSLFGLRELDSLNFLGEAASFQARMNYAAGDGEMMNMARVARQRIVSAGGAYHGQGAMMVFEGDSLTANALTPGLTRAYPNRMCSAFTPNLQGNNFAVVANTITDVMARFTTKLLPQCDRIVQAGKKPIVFLHIGANDYSSWSSTGAAVAWADSVATQFYDPLMARGIPVIASTIMANGGHDPTKIAQRNAANDEIRALSSRYSALADFAANANLNTHNFTYFGDLVHVNDAGAAIMEGIATAAVAPLIAQYR